MKVIEKNEKEINKMINELEELEKNVSEIIMYCRMNNDEIKFYLSMVDLKKVVKFELDRLRLYKVMMKKEKKELSKWK